MKVAITGHRPNKLFVNGWQGYKAGYPVLVGYYERVFTKLKEEEGLTQVISGMALGVDQAAAQAAINIGVPVLAVIPFLQQPNVWRHADKVNYLSILTECSEQVVLQTKVPRTDLEVSRWLNERNHYMVDRCDLVIALWDETPGGTGNCVKYAQTNKVAIRNAYKSWLKWRDALR